MLDDDAQYEAECQKIRKDNAQLLDNFRTWLRQSKLTENTIKKHVDNT
jgi:hypothetical protein